MTIKSNTDPDCKDLWQTPLWLFDALDMEFGFWLDAAASARNALFAKYFTEAMTLFRRNGKAWGQFGVTRHISKSYPGWIKPPNNQPGSIRA